MSGTMRQLVLVVCVFLTALERHVADARPVLDVENFPSSFDESQEAESPPVYIDAAAVDEDDSAPERKSFLDLPQGIDNTILAPYPDNSLDPNTIRGQNEWDFNKLDGGFGGVSNELYPSPYDDDIYSPRLRVPVQTTPPPPPPPRRRLSLLRLAQQIQKLERRMTARRADISREIDKETERRKEIELVIRRQGKLIRDLRVKNKFLRDIVQNQAQILHGLREAETEEGGETDEPAAPLSSQRFNRAAWSRI